MCNGIWEFHTGNMRVSAWSILRVVTCFVRHFLLPFLVLYVGNIHIAMRGFYIMSARLRTDSGSARHISESSRHTQKKNASDIHFGFFF